MNGLMLIAGLILNFYVCYQIYLSNTPSLASQFGIIYLFGLMTQVLILVYGQKVNALKTIGTLAEVWAIYLKNK
jgi:hypothetical protein